MVNTTGTGRVDRRRAQRARARVVVVVVTIVTVAVLGGWWVLRDDGGRTENPAVRSRTQPTPGASQSTQSSTPASCNDLAVISAWPIERRLAQLLMVGVDPTDPQAAQAAVSRYAIGGIFIGGDGTEIFAADGLSSLRTPEGIPVLVAVDEEGGRVQRINQLDGSIPSAREMAQTMSPAEVHDLALRRGQALRELGVTMDLAPVADVSDQAANQVIGDRSFSDDPTVVSEYANAFAAGLREAGVIPVFKHFPGHGHALGDSHESAATTPSLDALRSSDLLPYRAVLQNAAAGVMIGHLDVPGLTSANEPASISPAAVNGLLREELGWDGFVMTDDLSGMRAITGRYDLPEAALRALQAGVDMALWVTTERVDEVLDRLKGAVSSGELGESIVNRSVQRVLAVKGFDPCVPV